MDAPIDYVNSCGAALERTTAFASHTPLRGVGGDANHPKVRYIDAALAKARAMEATVNQALALAPPPPPGNP